MSSSFKHNLRLTWQFLKLMVISAVVFIFIVIIGLGLLTWVYRDNIKKAFIEELGNNLKSEMHIGSVGVNFFRSFPLVSVTLNDITLLEAVDKAKADKDTLLNARRVYFQFNIIDLLKKEYKIRQMEVSLAEFNPVIFKDGSVNYDIWHSPEEATAESFTFDFERVLLRRVNVNFSDFSTNSKVSFLANRADLKGSFGSDIYALAINGDFFVDVINIDNTEFVAAQNTKLDIILDVYENKHYVFRKGFMAINAHMLEVIGEIDTRGEYMFLDLDISSHKLTLENFIADMPPFVKSYFDDYRMKGELSFRAAISGTFSSVVNPFVSAEFGVTNAELTDRSSGIQMKGLSFKGNYNNGRFRNLTSSSVALREFSTRVNNGLIEGELLVMNFTRPAINLNIKSDILLADLLSLLKTDNIINPKGHLELDLSFNGNISDGKQLRPADIISSTTRGRLGFNGLGFFIEGDLKEYKDISGQFVFNNNDVVVEQLKGFVSSSDFLINGYFRNFLSYFFFDDQKLYVDANLRSHHLNFTELLYHEGAGTDTTYRLTFSDRLNFRLTTNIDNIVFKNFEANNVNGRALMREQLFMAENISLSTMEGRINLTGSIDGKTPDVLRVACEAETNNIDIQKLFFQMNNFGQTAIKDEHLRGKLNSTVQFSANWSPYLDIDLNSILADADLRIDDGELINFDPILQMSRFLRIGDLQHINFSTLENQISIKNQTIFIPFMEIKSSALDLNLSGQHKFNNEIDYRVQVALSDILAQRSRQNRNPQEQYGEIIDDGHSRTLYLLITGTIDDPIFRYDTRAVRERIRENLREERQVLRDVLREEFLRTPKDTIIEGVTPEDEQQKIKEREEIRKGKEGDFIIEWD